MGDYGFGKWTPKEPLELKSISATSAVDAEEKLRCFPYVDSSTFVYNSKPMDQRLMGHKEFEFDRHPSLLLAHSLPQQLPLLEGILKHTFDVSATA